MLVLSIILQLLAGVLNVKGAFLQGKFGTEEEQICLTVPDRLEDKYETNLLLKLLAPIYGLKMQHCHSTAN